MPTVGLRTLRYMPSILRTTVRTLQIVRIFLLICCVSRQGSPSRSGSRVFSIQNPPCTEQIYIEDSKATTHERTRSVVKGTTRYEQIYWAKSMLSLTFSMGGAGRGVCRGVGPAFSRPFPVSLPPTRTLLPLEDHPDNILYQ
jgi:hypothetical protein